MPAMRHDRLTVNDLEPIGSKLTLELIDGELAVNGTSHGSGTHARFLVYLLTHAPTAEEDAPAASLTGADLGPLGAGAKLELVDGDLHINGRSHGHGWH